MAIFRESDPVVLHTKNLNSQILNWSAEAKVFSLSSFKYHLSITRTIFHILKNGIKWHKLYLTENVQTESPF